MLVLGFYMTAIHKHEVGLCPNATLSISGNQDVAPEMHGTVPRAVWTFLLCLT